MSPARGIDDSLLALNGRIVVRMGDGDVEPGSGELFVVPAGVDREPVVPEP